MKEIFYSEVAAKQLKKINVGNRKSASAILEAIEKYASSLHGTYDIKELKGKLDCFKRLRVGKYRVIFNEDDNRIHIFEIKHRQEAYHD